MEPDRLEQIQDLFAAALALPVSQQGAYVARAAPDAALAAEVLDLLRAHNASGALDRVAAQVGALAMAEAEPPPSDPGRVGPYAIVRPIGRGGMGAVYLAERADGQARYQIALKLLRRDLDSVELRRRFLAERQILARISHPNIARLMDAGITEEGRPYFVMELVEGLPIDRYCDACAATIPQRLELFRTVCAAVQHAHRHLVVHRDLKPGNILVAADGTVKLLDFGIAKALDPEAIPEAAEHTATGVRLMTPLYASPEQLRGEPVTTASDVYQLGLLLFVLLTGRQPRPCTSPSAPGAGAASATREITKPSQAVADVAHPPTHADDAPVPTPTEVAARRGSTTERLRRRLSGDLDNIVLHALREEPSRRYGSVEQLSEDVRRHLVGLPVTARPETMRYRTAKFISRNRTGVIVSALAFLVLAVAGVGLVVSRDRALRAEAQARSEAAKSTAINDFLQRMLASVDPVQGGRSVKVADVLDQAAGDIGRSFQGQPDVEAAVRVTVGRTYRGLGIYEDADTQLREALTLRLRTLPAGDPQTGEALHELGLLAVARGDYAAADSLLRLALGIRQHAFGPRHVELANSMSALAGALTYAGQYAAADSLYRGALKMQRALLGEQSLAVAATSNDLATLLYAQGQYAEAEAMFRAALATRRSLLVEHPHVSETLNNLAMTLRALDRPAEVEPLYREALALNRKIFGQEHPTVAQSMNNLGVFLSRRGQAEEAVQLIGDALAMNRKLLGTHPDVAANLHNLALVLHAQREYPRAEALFREAVDLDRRFLGEHHPTVASTLNNLGTTLTASGQFPQAERIHRQALAIQIDHFGEDAWQCAMTRSLLGGSLTQAGRLAEAEPLVVGGFQTIHAKFGATHGRTRDALGRVIALYERLGSAEKLAEYRALLPQQ